MPELLALTAALAALTAPAEVTGVAAEDPRAVVRQVTRAVEEDAATSLRTVWQARLGRDAMDRAALFGLGTLARMTYDYPAAEGFYRRLYDSVASAPDRFAAYAHLGQAWALWDRGRSNDASAEFTRALTVARALNDRLAEGEALIALSFTRGRAEGVQTALALLDAAGRLIPEDALDLHAERLRRRAIVLGMAGSPRAMAEAEASIDVARRAGDLRAEAHGLRAVARILAYRGQKDSTLAILRQAEELFAKAHDHSWLAVTMGDRAAALLTLGDLGEAKEALQQSLAEAETSHNLYSVAVAHTGFGDIAIRVNDIAAASEHLNKAVAMYESQGDPGGAVVARRFLVFVALAAGNLVDAKRQALDLLALARRMDFANDQFWLHRALAAIAMRERDWVAAAGALDEAKALARRLRLPEALALDEGLLGLFRGDLAAAERSLTAYLRTLKPAEHVPRHRTRLRLAEIYARRGELARAEREAVTAWDELDRWRATLGDRELRLLAFQTSPDEFHVALAGRSEQDASVARVLGALAAGGRVDVAFELAERRRARELVDGLLQAEALRTGGGSTRPASGRAAAPIAVADFAALLPDRRTALLEFVASAEDVPGTLFVVTQAGARAYPLSLPESLSAQVARFDALLESGSEPGPLARTLGQALLEPALAGLGPEVDRLVIVPDGPLHDVPWDALRVADGRYLVEQYAVSIAPSAAAVAALWRRANQAGSSPRPVRLLAFGDPALARQGQKSDGLGRRDEAADGLQPAFEAAGGLPRLEASTDEAKLVARYAQQAEVRLREAASAAFLKHAPLSQYRVVHFATHALVDERTVARTALALAADENESGFLGPGDLAALQLDADLVVLSACRTARGVVVEGEGIQGLTASFLQAGARSVVATGWRIGDRATVAFVRSFYDALARGLPVGDSLRSAKLDALRRGANPREWAAFTAVGDPLVTIPLRARSPLEGAWPALLIAAALALVGTAVYSLRTRRLRRREARTPDSVVARTPHRYSSPGARWPGSRNVTDV